MCRNKECPTCRKKLVSKRSLRPDPNFDALISKIYPSRDEYEAHQERVLARISKHNNQQALSHSIEEGLKIQALNRSLHTPLLYMCIKNIEHLEFWLNRIVHKFSHFGVAKKKMASSLFSMLYPHHDFCISLFIYNYSVLHQHL